ncbi:hypothetical protein M9H77_35196 [Catharanthus roseus]|uniref:Uncharacterized protein n=1 Tax=Catharanthus roseus TaxID=4058 RepID=A0ACB9ZNB5_CATRO|nr:hypothetical protein M9H77_35196 [Catharanthus roseus]
MASQNLIPILAITLVLLFVPSTLGQFTMPCTTSMLTSFTPCMNFITNSSLNGTSPSAECCNVLKSFTSNGTDCLCLIVTGSVPFRIPINRTLAINLPQACNMPGVPLQCKATGAPVPAPGPIANGPSMSPASSPSPSTVPLPISPSEAPQGDETPTLTPPSPTGNSGSPPSSNSGNRQAVNPSAASTQSFSPFILLVFIGAISFNFFFY